MSLSLDHYLNFDDVLKLVNNKSSISFGYIYDIRVILYQSHEFV